MISKKVVEYFLTRWQITAIFWLCGNFRVPLATTSIYDGMVMLLPCVALWERLHLIQRFRAMGKHVVVLRRCHGPSVGSFCAVWQCIFARDCRNSRGADGARSSFASCAWPAYDA